MGVGSFRAIVILNLDNETEVKNQSTANGISFDPQTPLRLNQRKI